MKSILRLDWDVIAGVAAAVIALVLHLLHIVETDIVFTIVLVLLALLLIRDLRRESHDERLSEDVKKARSSVEEIQLALQPTDTILIGPRNLRAESQRFAESSDKDVDKTASSETANGKSWFIAGQSDKNASV